MVIVGNWRCTVSRIVHICSEGAAQVAWQWTSARGWVERSAVSSEGVVAVRKGVVAMVGRGWGSLELLRME